MSHVEHVLPFVDVRETAVPQPKSKARGPGAHRGREYRCSVLTDTQLMQLRLWYWRDCLPVRECVKKLLEVYGVVLSPHSVWSLARYVTHTYVAVVPPEQVRRGGA